MGGSPADGVRLGGHGLTATVEQGREQRNARLESLRAIGALSVVCAHTLLVSVPGRPDPLSLQDRFLLAGGSLIFLFFVLTGCLLFAPFARLLGRSAPGRRVDLKRYFLNRALRLLPLYYVTCVVLYLVPPADALAARSEDLWRFPLFLQFTSEESAGRLNPVLWTLVVEFHFYLVLPLLAFVVIKLARGSLGRAATIIGVLALASFALRTDRMLADDIDPTDPFSRISMPALFFYFAAGMLIALLRRHLEDTGRRLPGSPGEWLLGALVLWVLAIAIRNVDPLNWAAAVLTVGACYLPLQRGGGLLARALEWRPLVLIGVVSYSLYLWHAGVILWIGDAMADGHQPFLPLLAIGVPASLVVAVLSYNVIERPFLMLRQRWISGRPRPPAVEPSVSPATAQ